MVTRTIYLPATDPGVGGGGSDTVLDAVGELVRSNSNVRESLYTFTIPGGTLAGVGSMLRLSLQGFILQVTGVNQTMVLDVQWDGALIWQTPASSVASNANLRPFRLPIDIWQTQTAAIIMHGLYRQAGIVLPPVGYGVITGSPQNDQEFGSALVASDLSLAHVLDVGVTMSIASPNYVVTRHGALLEALQ